jgi:hypothetical protein
MKTRSHIVTLAVCVVSALGVPAAQAELVSENGSAVLAKASSSQSTLAAMRKAGVSYHATAKAKSTLRIDRSLPSYPRHGFEPTG